MKKIITALAVASGIALASSAHAAIGIDGVLDSAYGAPTAVVGYDPAALTSNFGQDASHPPGANSNAIGYSIYLTSDANNVYGFLQASGQGAAVGPFANLYFDVDPGNGASPDIMFEVTNAQGKILGAPSFTPVPITYFASGDIIEFSIPDAVFTAGALDDGDQIYLRLSQSFGYSVAGGSTFGPNGLGSVTLGGAVPEPASWAMMILGFLGIGGALRARRRQTAFA